MENDEGNYREEMNSVTRIYACATVWHETPEELLDLLESILRIDEDQCRRRVVRRQSRIVDPDYYELETHVFLDDAFEINSEKEHRSRANRFVRRFVATVGKAVAQVYEAEVRVKMPTKAVTPYGGRLTWTLPGETKMILHLKDRTKIRIKKRWSQVMYIRFLLGHCLVDLPLTEDQRKERAENTYLLTLDGDVSFQPRAVLELVRSMKRNKNLGAVCGRLHPVGNGPIVWYQIFEYATSHWLQKTTENMIGCVLCSPGCFSLYRAQAVMNDNVIGRYTAKPVKARHYVQYDQGEDRWLSTLLMQAGYRVEYAAASDAYTHCPENFSEFFNQRRRWIPSTAANILDSLFHCKQFLTTNESVTRFYIVYQFIMMIFSILAPGTVFLMLVDACKTVLNIGNWTSLYFNTALTTFFVFVCFTRESELQLRIAQPMSTFYALIVAASFIVRIRQICLEGVGSAILFVLTWSALGLAAVLHPREIGCIVFVVVYIVLIPCTHFLMNIYSVINLNNISWGTRETDAHHQEATADFGEEKRANKECIEASLVRSETSSGSDQGRRKYGSTKSAEIGGWMDDEDMQKGSVTTLSSHENEFWMDLINRTLYPLNEDQQEKANIARNLKCLRNRVASAFLVINVLFVLTVFLLQTHQVQLVIEWPFNIETTSWVNVSNMYMKLEPLDLLYGLSFTIQMIQFGGMMFHQFGTLERFLTSLDLTNFCRRKIW